MRVTFGALIIALLFAATARAEVAAGAAPPSVDTLLGEGVVAYEAGLAGERRDLRLEGFRRAELLFGEANARGAESASLFINLGNAALQAEHLGPAVLAYRRALRLDPTATQAEQNLGHARSQLPQWVPVPQEGGAFDSFFFWHRSVPAEDRSRLAAFCFALASLFAGASIVRRSDSLRNLALIPGIAWAVLVVSLVLDPARGAVPEAVVVQDVVARSADSANAPLRFADPLPAGAEVRILDDRGAWLQIALHNGRSAWVNASAVGRIDD